MKGGGLGEAGERVAKQRIETIDRILAIAETRDADFVVVAGDVF
jgi:DNA repair exonuclease SbcCD nuclease subunit